MLFNIILQLVVKSLSEEFLFPLPTSLPIRLDICYALITTGYSASLNYSHSTILQLQEAQS